MRSFLNRVLVSASLGHFSTDMYSGMLPFILLIQTDALGLTYSQVGTVAMLFQLTGSLFQPLFGWLGDRRLSRALAVGGILAIATATGMMLAADHFYWLALLAVIAGLGSGAFHPQGALWASEAASERRGSAMSVFMLGGNAGFAFGPVFGAFALATAGGLMPEMLAGVGVAQAALIFWAGAAFHRRQVMRKITPRGGRGDLVISVALTLALVIFLRSWVSTVSSTFIPQFLKAQGMSTAAAGAVLSTTLFALAAGGIIGGNLSDRIGRRRVLTLSTAFITPAMWMLLNSQGSMVYVWGVCLGLFMGASFPVTIVMSQELLPSGLGLVSGIALGLNFIAGAAGLGATGFLADQIGLANVMNLNALLPLGAMLLSLLLPPDRLPRTAAA